MQSNKSTVEQIYPWSSIYNLYTSYAFSYAIFHFDLNINHFALIEYKSIRKNTTLYLFVVHTQLLEFITMFYLLTSILFSTVACETSNPCTLKCVSCMHLQRKGRNSISVSNTLGNGMDMFRVMFLDIKYNYFMLKKFCL